jgi:replicative DNA helicase
MTDFNSTMNEMSVIGSILLAPEKLYEIMGILSPEDFENELYGDVYRIILSLHKQNEVIDPAILAGRCASSGMGTGQECRGFMMQLLDVTPTAAHAVEYAKAVREAATKRRIAELGLKMAENSGGEAEEAISEIQKEMELLRERLHGDEPDSNGLVETMQMLERISTGDDVRVRTKMATVDKILGGGFKRGSLNIIAARPGVGKTSIALNIADDVAASQGEVLFFSLEMPKEELNLKRISRVSGISVTEIASREYLANPESWQALTAASAALNRVPLTFCDRSRVTTAYMEMVCRKKKNLKMVVVDYIQLISSTQKNREIRERVTEISRELKILARTLNVPVVALSQFSRDMDKGRRRPVLSDLRDSGSLEQDADTVLLLSNNADYSDYPTDAETEEGTVSLMMDIAKNRHGRTGKALIKFAKPSNLVYSVAEMRNGEYIYESDSTRY